jgi:hypothetical protein
MEKNDVRKYREGAPTIPDVVVDFRGKMLGKTMFFHMLRFDWLVVIHPRVLQLIVGEHVRQEVCITTDEIFAYYYSYLRVMESSSKDYHFYYKVQSADKEFTRQLEQVHAIYENYSTEMTIALMNVFERHILRYVTMVCMEASSQQKDANLDRLAMEFEHMHKALYKTNRTVHLIEVTEGRDKSDDVTGKYNHCSVNKTAIMPFHTKLIEAEKAGMLNQAYADSPDQTEGRLENQEEEEEEPIPEQRDERPWKGMLQQEPIMARPENTIVKEEEMEPENEDNDAIEEEYQDVGYEVDYLEKQMNNLHT